MGTIIQLPIRHRVVDMKFPKSDNSIWIFIAGSTPFTLAAIVMFSMSGYYLYNHEWGSAVVIGLNAMIASIPAMLTLYISKTRL